ncbi:hypothetical protein ES703_74506 [subsurface metagenome]
MIWLVRKASHCANRSSKGFGYRVYRDEAVDADEVDDLVVRRVEIGKAKAFYGYRDRLRGVARYAGYQLPALQVLDGTRQTLFETREQLSHLSDYVESEAALLTHLLEPAEEAIQSYASRYLQAFDLATKRVGEARREIEALASSPQFQTLERMADVRQLGSDPCPALRDAFREALDDLPRTDVARATVERELKRWPEAPSCAMTLHNASDWLHEAEQAVERCQQILHQALVAKASLLHSDALRGRLEQGSQEPFVQGVLAADTAESLADCLVETLGGETGSEKALGLVRRYLREIRVIKLRLSDFQPSKRTIERDDLDQVVAEFRAFLESALEGEDDRFPVVELD